MLLHLPCNSLPVQTHIGPHVSISENQLLVFVCFWGFSRSWKAKKQSTIACSSAEAEYRVLAATTNELIWLQQLLLDFHIHLSNSALIFCDNNATIYIASNPIFHEQTKHIEIDCHFVHNNLTA